MKTFSLCIILILFCNGFAQIWESNEYALASYENYKAITYPAPDSKMAKYAAHILNYFPGQLSNPEAKKRHSMSQFGYIFPLAEFIKKGELGEHSYGQPGKKEKNGSLYTLKGGFIDFSHVRVGLDWTVYLTFKIIVEEDDFELPPEAGTLELSFKNINKMNLEDISSMAQKIAFERLLWHEVASWHYHRPYYNISEQMSAFTPEDLYSNAVGTEIGKKVALRLLNNKEGLSYSQVATEEIEKYIATLEPVPGKKETIEAYKIVDLTRQNKLPLAERNTDVWWESRIVFINQKYVFKRYMDIGPQLEPWLVPKAEQLVDAEKPDGKIIAIPQKTKSGKSFYSYYEFVISPNPKLFTQQGPLKNHHTAFGEFSTDDFPNIIDHVRKEMELIMPGFDKRNCQHPKLAQR